MHAYQYRTLMYIQMYMDWYMHIIHMYLHTDYIYIYIYTYAHPPTRTYLLLYFIDCFIARSTICYLPSAKKKHNKQPIKTKNTKTKCIGEPSPLPPSQSRSPKTLFFIVFVLVLLVFFKDLIPRIYPDYIIKINPSQIWFIWPLRHHVSIINASFTNHLIKQVLYAKHAQVFLEDVQFSF